MTRKEMRDTILAPVLDLIGITNESNNSEEYLKLLDSIISAVKQEHGISVN